MKSFIFVLLITALSLFSRAQDTAKAESPKAFSLSRMPEFRGGTDKLNEFLLKNLKYPGKARRKNIQGTVLLELMINADGSITDITVINGVGGGCTEEAIRVIKLMPNWQPAMQGGKPVAARFRFPVTFKFAE